MQRSDTSVTFREGLSNLRYKIRAPLLQIISYAELMSEAEGQKKDSTFSTRLSDILAACEPILRVTSSPPAFEDPDTVTNDLQQEFFRSSPQILKLSEQLHQLAALSEFATYQGDAGKLRHAAEALHDLFKRASETSIRDLIFSQPQQTREMSRPLPQNPQAPGNGFSTAAQAGKSNLGQKGLLLVVDDNEGNRDVLSRRLLRDGCEVMLAETGRQALRMARRYKFDLILLDIMMPEMDGFAVLDELKKDPRLRYIPVIMISAIDEIESVVRCIELGADDYLTKPFNPVLLRARVNALLERKRLRDEETRRAEELQKALADVDSQRKKTEQLLLNILPASIAEELQTQGSVQPMYFEDVTIVFADFVGFTLSTEELPADDLVRILHAYFTAFDTIMGRYGMEKLKTIGDCYMFVGGMPIRNPSHPVDAVLAAFEMLQVTRQMADAGPVSWDLRIGIHTGPVVAGVVGIHKFAFDIWGDAVNFSSRMESSGAPGRVNLSASTYARVKDFFACEKRGKVRIKDGREVEMYFVTGVAAGLLADKSGAPLKAFEQRYHTYFRKQLAAFPDFLAASAG